MKKILCNGIPGYDDTQNSILGVLKKHGFGSVRVNHARDNDNRYYANVTRHNKIEVIVDTREVNVYFIDAQDQAFDVAYLKNLISAANEIEHCI